MHAILICTPCQRYLTIIVAWKRLGEAFYKSGLFPKKGVVKDQNTFPECWKTQASICFVFVYFQNRKCLVRICVTNIRFCVVYLQGKSGPRGEHVADCFARWLEYVCLKFFPCSFPALRHSHFVASSGFSSGAHSSNQPVCKYLLKVIWT